MAVWVERNNILYPALYLSPDSVQFLVFVFASFLTVMQISGASALALAYAASVCGIYMHVLSCCFRLTWMKARYSFWGHRENTVCQRKAPGFFPASHSVIYILSLFGYFRKTLSKSQEDVWTFVSSFPSDTAVSNKVPSGNDKNISCSSDWAPYPTQKFFPCIWSNF